MLAILGAGPHGQQLSDLYPWSYLYDDNLEGYRPISEFSRHEYLIGAVWPKVRRQIFDKLPPGSQAHKLGRVVFPGAHLGHGVHLGEHVHVLYNAVVSHGCKVGDFTTICSGAILCGEVTVESGAFIGAGAVIRHGGITIGRNATIGMGAVVVDDVPDGAKVVGNPAKVLATP